ncbi:mitochondrial carrier [Atractiella rhizophila]|nr:mitochondrial carrier [Atractiella rhizophila]
MPTQPLPSSSEKGPDIQSLDYIIRTGLAGGFAGGLAKTSIAPLDRVKILFQTNHQDFAKYTGWSIPGSWRGIGQSLQHIVKTHGMKGLFRGHSLTLARTIPHAAIGYTAYDQAKAYLMATPETQTPFRRFLCGVIAGTASLPVTYPFELIRVRMATDTRHTTLSPVAAIRSIYHEGEAPPPSSSTNNAGTAKLAAKRAIRQTRRIFPILQFYRGFAVSLVGTVPYRGGIFLVWETLNSFVHGRMDDRMFHENRTRIHFVLGAISGATAQVATYPLEVVRRLQQVGGTRNPDRMISFWEVVQEVWKTRGVRGFYVGLGLGLVKQVPMTSISLTSYWWAKRVLGIDQDGR